MVPALAGATEGIEDQKPEKSFLEELGNDRLDGFSLSSFRDGTKQADLSLKNGLYCNYDKTDSEYAYRARRSGYLPGYYQECKDLEKLVNSRLKEYEKLFDETSEKMVWIRQFNNHMSIYFKNAANIMMPKKPLSSKQVGLFIQGMDVMEKSVPQERSMSNMIKRARQRLGEELLTFGFYHTGYKLRRVEPFKVITDPQEIQRHREFLQKKWKELFENPDATKRLPIHLQEQFKKARK